MHIVKLDGSGRVTIPVKIRRKLGLGKGSQLTIEATAQGLTLRPIPRLGDMAGADARHGTVEEIKKEIDELREGY